jgi:hypothetical protein
LGKIIASYLIKLHLHALANDELLDQPGELAVPTNDQVKDALVAGLEKELGGEISVSLIERTDD